MKTRFVLSEEFSGGTESPKEIPKCTGIALATVYRGVKNIRAGRGVEQQEGSGRLRKLNETDRSRLGQLVRFEKFKTLTSFRNEMIERRSPAVFKQTMLNELNSLDWEKKRAFPAPSLTDR